jgi:FMN phosphatase YigB (HAD superfamily)
VARFDAVLFDAGGVLVLPDPDVLGPLLARYGGSMELERHRRAHYAGMKAKSDRDEPEGAWGVYDDVYVAAVGVPPHERDEASFVLGRTRSAWLWRWTIPETRHALDELASMDVPMGVVSNASGQIESTLVREVCQVGPGAQVEMRCIVDSELVGVAKPDPGIFEHALAHFEDIDRSRIAYVGDSVTMDIASSSAAGLHAVLLDPYDDHEGADFERVRSVADVVEWF